MADRKSQSRMQAVRRALIVGAGRTGVELARRLGGAWEVTLLDLDTEPARTALADWVSAHPFRFAKGDGTSRLVLEEAGARTMDAVAVAAPPDFVSGASVLEDLRRNQAEVRRLGAAYGQPVTALEVKGNPVHSVLELARDHQLLVLGHSKARGGSLLRPSAEQNLIHRAACSVLAIPH